MLKAVAKSTFGVPSTETLSRIDTSDKVSLARALGFRYDQKLKELEVEFDNKASDLRNEYLAELAKLQSTE